MHFRRFLLFLSLAASTCEKHSLSEKEKEEYFVMEDASKETWTVDYARDRICKSTGTRDSSSSPADCHDLFFIPTREYKAILPGQRVPKGLHISMDLTTGVKLAKIMEGDDSKVADTDKSASLVPVKKEIMDTNEKAATIHKPSDLENQKQGPNKRDLTLEEKGSLRDIFVNDLKAPINDSVVVVRALDLLADVAHDLHVGQGIAFHKEFIDRLLLLLGTTQLPGDVAKDALAVIRAKAAKVLVAVTSNNEYAIQLILSDSPDFIKNLFNGFKAELQIMTSTTSVKTCKVCLKRIFQVIAMVSRTDLDGFRLFMNENPFTVLLEAIKLQESLKDKVYTFLRAVLERLTVTDPIDFHAWCAQLKLDQQQDLLKKFSEISPECSVNWDHQEL